MKGKKLPDAQSKDARMLSDREEEEEEEEEGEVEAEQQRRWVSGPGWAGKGLGTTVALRPVCKGKQVGPPLGSSPRPSRSPRSCRPWPCTAVPAACGPCACRLPCPSPARSALSVSARLRSSSERQVGVGTSGIWGQEGSGSLQDPVF